MVEFTVVKSPSSTDLTLNILECVPLIIVPNNANLKLLQYYTYMYMKLFSCLKNTYLTTEQI